MCLVLAGSMIPALAAQQKPAKTTNVTCSFQDGRQMSVRYHTERISGNKRLPEGKIWMPGGMPMLLFTQSELSIDNSEIPIGAYSMYLIPQKTTWTLVVNRNVAEGSKYDRQQDLLRTDTQIGQVSDPTKQFSVVLGHVAPEQCNMRMYYGKTGAWAEFKQK